MQEVPSVPLLRIDSLRVESITPTSAPPFLQGINLRLMPNEILGVVGETGAGKSLLARAILDLLPEDLRVTEGEIFSRERPLSRLSPAERRAFRGGEVALIGTNAKELLDPVVTVGSQLVRVLRSHHRVSRREAWARAVSLLAEVGIVNAKERAHAYPHELSGGMAQRVVIAMSLISEPKVVLADDATLGLDATVSVQVLDMLVERTRKMGVSVILITHDLGIVAHYCNRVAVMRSGRIEEIRDTVDFLARPDHRYSQDLLEAAKARPIPWVRSIGKADTPLLEVSNLVKIFPGKRPGEEVRAVDGVSFLIPPSETLALVGESGSGKTTIGQCLVRLLQSDSGRVLFDGQEITTLSEARFRPLRRRIQMVFQEPYVALNPRWRVRHLVDEPLRMLDKLTSAERLKRVHGMLELVRLPARYAELYPYELTAGEQKRVGMARALISRPDFVIFDEPTTALDIRVRAQIIDLVRQLQSDMQLSALFITHDLNSVRSLAHNVAVMNRGRIVEMGSMEEVFARPKDPYTQKLLAAELGIEGIHGPQGSAAAKKKGTVD
ncbi:peptide/nickel transport system ATP-binding protein [Arboricoccus pini]|uniref:Peptide/nickel transport system ATP-binding protein n=1 Tax=Arboricoccus pini TaxID=1963835 RepID=A0A212RKX0_9PROT|nr:ABC transporter ATP-binding protein [Arboricoccus pini]SNB73109.1 peptide/nickel transport system ATP-binding protein [Arboricoccus pini]